MSRTLSSLNSGLIWAGAGISASAIVVGTWIAPLGWRQGLLAIILGHLLGGILFFAAGFIGAKTGKNAMQTVQISFGKGSVFFSLANVLQLVGWTAIMIYTGAEISNALSLALWGFSAFSLWAVLLGVLIILWLFTGSNQLGKSKLATLIAMFGLTLWLSVKVLNGQPNSTISGEMPFSTAVELATIMPLSWLPLVSDYTSKAKKPFAATFFASVGYLLTSGWMYALGLGMVLFTGQSEIAPMLLLTGMSLVGIVVMILSTVTTTFLDAYSAGVSASNICAKLKETPTAIAVTLIGTLLALSLPVTQYENFLLLIGSVFAPMIAVQMADFFVLKRTELQAKMDWLACGLWFTGFLLYHILSYNHVHLPLGLTIPVMLVIFMATIIVRKRIK
ncbi:putative hydroxymethylpyrimidine transporter CytX [Mannheimia pernigra]|uniref:putative hydroxymethylpyrimidine transporter CytX n=1 Tax=Mannheimia pernigra TaxID=111844 RepID=UPI00159F4D9B|nr:putative hydroxymethylpyrimidine transporter CytX [Mannheimia pernigra]QLB44066.1 putative hydroxymethylpyrimidine transporter CytX [Mannheimia pernigra]